MYDVSEKFVDPRAGGFSNDLFMTKNEHTYYFKPESEGHGFQLYRHSYGTPFQKFPIDNNPFPVHNNVKMENYFIAVPKSKDLRDLQIQFLKNAS